jgi:DNA-binding transcriptional MerR regulator
MYKVREVAETTVVNVRTQHPYDRIGLLKPDAVSSATREILNLSGTFFMYLTK